MPQIICKLPNDNYLLWSTVVDAPVTYGLPRDLFDAHMREELGNQYMEFDHPRRMARADEAGTSSMICKTSFAELIEHNRAGPGESKLTLEEIVETYGKVPA